MNISYQRLITTSLLISSFIFLCGVGSCIKLYTISGTVDGDVIDGITISLTGDISESTTTDSNGDYSFTNIINGSYTVTPSLTNYTFTPVSEDIIIDENDETGVDFNATENAPAARFTDNGDGTVTDERTGLLWLKNANCFSYQIWSTATSSAAGLNNGECGLTDLSVEGDWRLPTKEEFQGIGTDPPTTWDSGVPGVTWTMPGLPFVSVEPDWYYWSSTEYSTNAWYAVMSNGSANGGSKASSFYVWPVRLDN